MSLKALLALGLTDARNGVIIRSTPPALALYTVRKNSRSGIDRSA